MKTYILKTIDRPSYWFYHMYDGDHMLTDAELDTVFGTAGSAHFVFDFDGTSANNNQFYIRNNADTQTKIAMSGVLDGGSGAIEEGRPFLGTWNANSSTFSSFVKLIGRTLSDEQLTFLMHEIKKKGDVVQTTGTSTTDVMSQNATTEMLWRDPSTKKTIQYNTWKYTSSNHGTDNNNIYIGANIEAREGSSKNNILIGDNTATNGQSGNSIVIGNYGSAFGDNVVSIGNQVDTFGVSKQSGAVAIGSYIDSVPGNSIIIGSKEQSYGVSAPSSAASDTIVIGADANTAARGAVAIGRYASATTQGEFNISLANKTDPVSVGYNGSNYRLLSGLAMPVGERDAASKGYVDSNTPTTFTTNEWNALWA